MANRVVLNVIGHPTTKIPLLVDGGKVSFTLEGLAKFLNGVEWRPDHFEGDFGDRVNVPVDLLLKAVQGTKVEVEGVDF